MKNLLITKSRDFNSLEERSKGSSPYNNIGLHLLFITSLRLLRRPTDQSYQRWHWHHDRNKKLLFALTSDHLNKRELIIWTPKYRISVVHAITEYLSKDFFHYIAITNRLSIFFTVHVHLYSKCGLCEH